MANAGPHGAGSRCAPRYGLARAVANNLGRLGRRLQGLSLDPTSVLERGEEEGLVDAALEDRDAQLHALCDDVTPLEPGLASQLGRRQVNGHRHSLLWGVEIVTAGT